MAGILTLQKRLQTGGDGMGQLKASEIIGKIDFKGQGHTNLRVTIPR
ncbi:MAG TPA: hypothetical protein VE999_15005 [Gemmataceae bacterium]|nr:hypothetical protein [Gemmataceae bacterium]